MSNALAGNVLVAETPADSNCFIGFHDIIPWAKDESCLAIHRASPDYARMEDCKNPIEICLWYPATGQVQRVDATNGWNFQQGSRLQWIPNEPKTLVFNSVENGKPVAVRHNLLTGGRRVLPAPIYAISPDGKTSIAPNFVTLAHKWKAYGYPTLENTPCESDQAADGLWQLDMETGEHKLFISTQRVAEFEVVGGGDPQSHFLCHPSFSPDGSKVLFLDRFFTADGGSFTRLIATDRLAKDLVLLAQEKVSHFDWLDNDTVMVWARFMGKGLAQIRSRGLLASPVIRPALRLLRSFRGQWKKQLMAECYYKISLNSPEMRTRYGWPELHSDGHPMVARSHRWIVTDFYPDRQGNLPVILYDSTRNKRVDAAVFHHKTRVVHTDVKCDLHPRWSRSERMVAVDTCEAGYRQVRILDVSHIVNQ